ncbi:MAG: reverse transcriptase domain-containing protein [Patescibacteria group bacterium]
MSRAWDVVKKRRDVAAGIDGVTVDEFEASLSSHLKTISKELNEQRYAFQAARKRAIPKDSTGATRDIHVFTVRDKIVQQAIQATLLAKKKEESLFPEVYNDIAIAYIPRLNGVAEAVKKAKTHYADGYIFLTNLDIQDFFDNIPGRLLFEKITKRLPDDSINWLIDATIKQKIYKISSDVDKVLQGSVLAPLYSNIYLSEFDFFLIKNGIRAVRYADDLALFSKNEDDAVKHRQTVREALKTLASMEFYPDDHHKKAPKIRCMNDFADFLGIRFSKGPRDVTVGPSPEKIDEEKQKITDAFRSEELVTFVHKINRSNRSINSWCQHYYTAGAHQSPMHSAIKEITDHYSRLCIQFLRDIAILSPRDSLTREQLNLLGVLGANAVKRKR